MKTKNFVLAGIAGGITDFLLGWLFYGIVFIDYFHNEQMPNLAHIFLGCLTFGFLMSYILVRWANLVTFLAGLKVGAVIGLLLGLMNNFFMYSEKAMDTEKFAFDVLIGITMGAIVGGVVALVNGMLSKHSDK
jgi:hypothetical protein